MPSHFEVQEIIEFLWETAKLKDYFLLTDKNKSVAIQHMELCLKTQNVSADGQKEFIILDLKVKIMTVFNYLWKVLCFDIHEKDNMQV